MKNRQKGVTEEMEGRKEKKKIKIEYVNRQQVKKREIKRRKKQENGWK